jgi:hypothetical protein
LQSRMMGFGKSSRPRKEEVTVSDGYPPHLNPKCPRPQLYSLSGFLRGTLDFPLQDTSELEDALEPLCAREEDWAAFFNRQCLVEIGSSEWRSLRVVRTSLGTCPYLALAQCMVLYHELLLSDLEKEIDRLLYQSPNGDELEKTVHAKAMVDISTTLRRAGDSLWPPSIKVVEQNLQQRLTIVRDLLIFRPVNIFSYKMEHDLFNALIANNEIEARTAAIINLLDRYEGIVQDTHQVLTTAAEKRLGLVAFLITVLGLLTIYGPIEALFANEEYDFLGGHLDTDRLIIVIAAFALLAAYLFWPRKR